MTMLKGGRRPAPAANGDATRAISGGRSIRLAGTAYPVVPPSVRDPRLHLAAVIISIHVLGQVAFGFRVSVPQILVAILTCAVIEVAWTMRASKRIAWPASAMLTGSGVALILRVVGTERGDHWTWRGWSVFALVAGLSLLTKYLVRHRGTHIFNPSNVGLVVAFLVLGSTRIEPLDFWWGPLEGTMVAAYLIILVGGLLITSRLGLLATALTFWAVLAGGLAVVAGSGHCVTAAWSLDPVCGADFWRIVVTSPEVLVFLFFMITDPRTIPAAPVARVAFAASVAVAGTLLIAPQTTEFGAKVGLLAGLTVMSPLRGAVERWMETAVGFWRRAGRGELAAGHAFGRGAVAGASVVLLAVGIVAAGVPAQGVADPLGPGEPGSAAVEIEASSLPGVSIDPEVAALDGGIEARVARDLAGTLAENLATESEARRRSDPSLLRAVDHGARLIEMERRIEQDAVAKRRVTRHHTFESLHLRPIYPDGTQSGPSLGFDVTGTVEEVTYDERGEERRREATPFASTFVLSQALGDRWMIVDEAGP